MTFGIPMDDFPVNANGQLRMEPYLRQVVFRQEQEQHLEAMERQKTHHILAPSPVDVLCGRGKPYQGKKIGHVFVVFFFLLSFGWNLSVSIYDLYTLIYTMVFFLFLTLLKKSTPGISICQASLNVIMIFTRRRNAVERLMFVKSLST